MSSATPTNQTSASNEKAITEACPAVSETPSSEMASRSVKSIERKKRTHSILCVIASVLCLATTVSTAFAVRCSIVVRDRRGEEIVADLL